MDKLLEQVFSDQKIWEQALSDGIEKKIKKEVLISYSDPAYREEIKQQIAEHAYQVVPPHEAQIPKDDGTMRTVYANEAKDRVLMTVINNTLFKLCPEMIHPACKSYQTGIGCGMVARNVVKDLKRLQIHGDKLGYKIDLSKYFDSVPIEYIEQAFKDIEAKVGKSAVLDLLWDYYHDNRLYDLDKHIFEKYTSLRQGCAVAAFLADVVLYDIDAQISAMPAVSYYRYSDDILILGEAKDADEAFGILSAMLEERSLKLNPKKVEQIDADHWFTFLGFSIRNDQISLSKKRTKNLQKVIQELTLNAKTKTVESAARKVYRYLYGQSNVPYSYCEGILSVINNKHDIMMIDTYIMDCIRACATQKTKIGGLGYNKTGKDGVIVRGLGRNVKQNKIKLPEIPYTTMSFMQSLFNSDKDAYHTYAKSLILT